ncbi:hypothetical protein PYW07_004780 [Mythimna separata]|uniref:Diapausin n=1 Tax=Mythimna separata TaxID=271217 RepID=A0AAD7YXW1_MYTSE|nr:hypothetical protein PYW07_004780 [Mythimna separata]
MAAIKTAFILLLVAFAMVMVTVEAVRVGPCDQVCSRIDAEKDECCRAHGWSGYSSCRYGQMQFTRPTVRRYDPTEALKDPKRNV